MKKKEISKKDFVKTVAIGGIASDSWKHCFAQPPGGSCV